MNNHNEQIGKRASHLKPSSIAIWVLVLLLLLPIAGILKPDTAFACDCAIPQSAKQSLTENAAVFAGKVLAMRGSKWTGQFDEGFDAVLLEIDQIWKGVEQSQIVVYNPISSCQYDFKVGDSYLVYANANGGELVASNCSRTAEITQASADLNELGPGVPPRVQVNLLTTFQNGWLNGTLITVIAVVLILVPIAGLLYRYRARK